MVEDIIRLAVGHKMIFALLLGIIIGYVIRDARG